MPGYDPLRDCVQNTPTGSLYYSAARQPLASLPQARNQYQNSTLGFAPVAFNNALSALQQPPLQSEYYSSSSSSLSNTVPSSWPYRSDSAFLSTTSVAEHHSPTSHYNAPSVWGQRVSNAHSDNPCEGRTRGFTWMDVLQPQDLARDDSVLDLGRVHSTPPPLPPPPLSPPPPSPVHSTSCLPHHSPPPNRSLSPLEPTLDPNNHQLPSPQASEPFALPAVGSTDIPGSPQRPSSPVQHHDITPATPSQIGAIQDSDKLTWAARNLGRPVLPPRSHPSQQKCTRAERQIRTEANRLRNEALQDALSNLRQTLDEGLQKIAQDHNKDVATIRNLFFYSKHTKYHAKPSLGNALVSFKAEQLNEGTYAFYIYHCSNAYHIHVGKHEGEKARLPEIREALRDDPDLQDLTKADEEDLLDRLLEKRGMKLTGVRASHTAASLDKQSTIQAIRELVRLIHTTCHLLILFRCYTFTSAPAFSRLLYLRVLALTIPSLQNILISVKRLNASWALRFQP